MVLELITRETRQKMMCVLYVLPEKVRLKLPTYIFYSQYMVIEALEYIKKKYLLILAFFFHFLNIYLFLNLLTCPNSFFDIAINY